MSTPLNDTFKRAVSPGPERLLAGVALAAAGSSIEERDYVDAFGTISLDPTSPQVVSNRTVMRLASCSKLVTSIAALQCVERGIFDLDSPADVERLLPEWSSPEILTGMEDGRPQLQPAKEKITLAQLLSHSSGLSYDFFPPLSEWRHSCGERPQAMCGEYSKAFGHPLVFEPGTGWAYGGGTDLAGLMVARANSCTLEEYMRKHIFSPLEMEDTSFRPMSHENLAQRLMPRTSRPSANGPLVDGEDPNTPTNGLPLDPKDDFGGSGLYGTAVDFLKLLKSILRNDGKLLKADTVDLMFNTALNPSSQAALDSLLSIDRFAGFMIPGERLVGTPGSGEWTHGLAGLVGLTSKEVGPRAPWLQWGGSPNLTWWIDRTGGTCGIFATQLDPPGERKHQHLGILFREEMHRMFGCNASSNVAASMA